MRSLRFYPTIINMKDQPLSTDPYKGVRDFYPEDMSLQQYIFDTWTQTAEQYGFQRYDASVLEPAMLYKSKGAANEEIVNEQTYTFNDRGDREVTLRPEMTPTVARMIARKQKELAFPVRWYSIPNLFRYERMQKGRLREHWQLNCDVFGPSAIEIDVELIQLAYSVFTAFGATEDMFEILVNNRATMNHAYAALGISDAETIQKITRLNDRKDKIDEADYIQELQRIVNSEQLVKEIKAMIETTDPGDSKVVTMLNELGINNVRLDRSLARGFDYYTGTIFEVKDTHPDNNRSLLGGGRYDNLTELFGSEAVSGIGFGLGDVTMKDFLITHNLLPDKIHNIVDIVILPLTAEQNFYAQKVATELRADGKKVMVDLSNRKLPKLLAAAETRGAKSYVVIGEEEMKSKTHELQSL